MRHTLRKALVLVSAGFLLLAARSGRAEVYGLEGVRAQGPAAQQVKWPRTDQELVTGLDVTWQWRNGQRTAGPSLIWGLAVVPGYVDIEAAVGAVLGAERYAIPVSFTVKGHLWANKWFVPYGGLGAGMVHEKRGPKEDWNDLQVRAVAGLGLNMPGLEWRFFVEGVYVLTVLDDEHHTLGVTPGFRYRF